MVVEHSSDPPMIRSHHNSSRDEAIEREQTTRGGNLDIGLPFLLLALSGGILCIWNSSNFSVNSSLVGMNERVLGIEGIFFSVISNV